MESGSQYGLVWVPERRQMRTFPTLVVIHLPAIAEERVGFVERQEDAACPRRVQLRRQLSGRWSRCLHSRITETQRKPATWSRCERRKRQAKHERPICCSKMQDKPARGTRLAGLLLVSRGTNPNRRGSRGCESTRWPGVPWERAGRPGASNPPPAGGDCPSGR